MDIFCRNVPERLKEKRLKKELAPILGELGIEAFGCQVLPRRHAIITIPDVAQARKLLERYPRISKGQKAQPHQRLVILGTPVYIEESRNKPDPFLVQSIRDEAEKLRESLDKFSISSTLPNAPQRQNVFPIRDLACGVFDFDDGNPVFVNRWNLQTSAGKITFERSKIVITMDHPSQRRKGLRLDFEYYIINECIYLGTNHASVTFSCSVSPALYEVQSTMNKQCEERKKRLSFVDSGHQLVVATSLVWRVMLTDAKDLYSIRKLSNYHKIPQMSLWADRHISECDYIDRLAEFLADLVAKSSFPFAVKFQLQMLAWNGELSISDLSNLYSCIDELLTRNPPKIVAKILKKLPANLYPPYPHANCVDFNVQAIQQHILDLEAAYHARDDSETGQRVYVPQNTVDIHRASVTPTGIYLYGPYPEALNRVLRRFSDYVDFFLRVEFVDEAGDSIMYDPTSDLEEIFNGRYGEVLRDGIVIAGRHFMFLGFSHSSLRSRSCWFLAPFQAGGELITADILIRKLGHFEHIFSPAKFAARLGQVFSDTRASIPIDRNIVTVTPDIKRNERVFSDGCGTLSKDILTRICREYSRRVKARPTVFQIRLSGAKGMLSLDSTLEGPQIRLRPSMIKFEADDWNLEICDSGISKLPCFLNTHLIKVLEDLGVAGDVLLELQKEEIELLRDTIRSARRAAHFLEHQAPIAESTRLPYLVGVLDSLDLHFSQDRFLNQVIELAVLVKLRDLKYRARIRVPNGVTLFGIMDETGFLKEGEIYVPILNDRSQTEAIIGENVIVTRSPALHPGDVQLANAVDVPDGSPLRQLYNCVVFSQHGSRDLPSQLSGGDLDGDLFSVISDKRFRLRRTARPASYPRSEEVVLNRPVTRNDISEFFVTFLRRDQLGRISQAHKVFADRNEKGTFSKNCLELAALHSMAVDFSKTGKPVDPAKIPRPPPLRPDWMKPGPRVKVADDLNALLAEEKHPAEDDDLDDSDRRPAIRYYKSQRILGQLYRAIDEREFLHDSRRISSEKPSADVLGALWDYVQRQTAMFEWRHCIPVGYQAKNSYQTYLDELMWEFSDMPWRSTLTEAEVFIGNIMGDSKQTVRKRENSKKLRDAYDDLVTWTTSFITGLETDETDESLARSIATFHVALTDQACSMTAIRRCNSFPWIAAAVCLQEVDKLLMH